MWISWDPVPYFLSSSWLLWRWPLVSGCVECSWNIPSPVIPCLDIKIHLLISLYPHINARHVYPFLLFLTFLASSLCWWTHLSLHKLNHNSIRKAISASDRTFLDLAWALLIVENSLNCRFSLELVTCWVILNYRIFYIILIVVHNSTLVLFSTKIW